MAEEAQSRPKPALEEEHRVLRHEYHIVGQRVSVTPRGYVVESDYGEFLLRRTAVSPERLLMAQASAEYAARRWVSKVPRFICTRFGDPFVVSKAGLWYLTPHWTGDVIDVSSRDGLMTWIRALGAWHQAMRGVWVELVEPTPVVRTFDQRLHAMLAPMQEWAKTMPADIQTSYQALEPTLNTLFHGIQALLPQAEAQAVEQGWLCLGDYSKPHATMHAGDVVFWNYERVYQSHPLVDVAMMLHRAFAVQGWDEELLQSSWETYLEANDAFRHEVDLLRTLLSVPLQPLSHVQMVLKDSNKSGANDGVLLGMINQFSEVWRVQQTCIDKVFPPQPAFLKSMVADETPLTEERIVQLATGVAAWAADQVVSQPPEPTAQPIIVQRRRRKRVSQKDHWRVQGRRRPRGPSPEAPKLFRAADKRGPSP